ncbi:Uncharacterised protein [uncultured archaeon]|nr:Uncharacterised protein [uncultured archaeon]
MIDLKNVLEVVNESIVLPIVIIAFLLLIYVVFYLSTRDPDVVRSRIFLKYAEFKKAFILLAAFAFVLVLHVALIYIPHFFQFEDYSFIIYMQRFGGLLLSLIMITFVYVLVKSIK